MQKQIFRLALSIIAGVSVFGQVKGTREYEPVPAPVYRPSTPAPRTRPQQQPMRQAATGVSGSVPSSSVGSPVGARYSSAPGQQSVQHSLNQYRQLYGQGDVSTRNSFLSPDAMQRMLNGSTGTQDMQQILNFYRQEYNQIPYSDRQGLMSPDELQRLVNGDGRGFGQRISPESDRARPDFVNGAPDSVLNSLRDFDTKDLDKLRGDSALIDPDCGNEIATRLASLRARAQALQGGIGAQDQGLAMVAGEAGAGTDAQHYGNVVAGLQAVKSTADAAIGIFGAGSKVVGNLQGTKTVNAFGMDLGFPTTPGEALSTGYSAAQKLVAASNSARNQDKSGSITNFANAANSQIPGASLAGALANDDPNEKARMALDGAAGVFKVTGNTGLADIAGAAGNVVDISKSLSEINGAPTPTQVAQIAGKTGQVLGTAVKQFGSESAGLGGAILQSGGKLVSTAATYNDDLGKAFDTSLQGSEDKLRLDQQNASASRQIAARRAELVSELQQVQAQIDSLSLCKQGVNALRP